MKKSLLLFLVIMAQLVAGITVHAQNVLLFDYGSTWKYLDDGSDRGTSWKNVGASEVGWSQATGIFGYGDSWITACVRGCAVSSCGSSGCGDKFITTYFRKTISITDVSQFSSVDFDVWRDDGIVLYVNGVKVWSDNMPATYDYLTWASATIDGASENTAITASIPISAFVNGNNVIAVEMHQRGPTSSDLTFNMKATAIYNTMLFNYGSSWKWFTGADLGTAWRAAGYNDASWATGTGHMGYGETWTTAPCVPAGIGCSSSCSASGCSTRFPTAYFRKMFNLPNPSAYDYINFSVFMDDGAVLYVNGTEVWRNNMPGTGTIPLGAIAYNTLASTTIAESTAVSVNIPISAFVAGTNQVAIEVHQNALTSSDMDFNARATGVVHVPPSLVRGPYLQNGNQTAFSVRWRTNVPCKSKLEVGTVAGTYPIVINDTASLTEHELRVTGLTPGTKYYYRFGTDADVLQGDTTNFWVTAPADGVNPRVTIAAYGDCGQNSNGNQSGSLASYRAYLNSIGLQAADMMLLVGDNAYNSGTDGEYQTGFFNAYQGNILKNHMLFPAPGNHDYSNGSSARQNDHAIPYYDIFTMPTAGECGGVPSGNEAYYSFDRGDVHILSLDSYGKENAGTTRLYDTLGAQVQWIKADLAANTKKWVIAYWHHPPYTMGSHNSNTEGELVSIRQNFIRILERYGVDVIICGHSHDYERSYLMKGHYGSEASFNLATHAVDNSSAKYDGSANSCPYTTPSGKIEHGTVYVVSGSSGASGGVQSGYPHDAFPFSLNDGGMFFLDINQNRLDAKFIRKTGTIWDQFTIIKDTKVQDTVKILYGNSVELNASWPGSYAWAPGVTTRTVIVTPTVDSMVEVKDALSATCLVDRHYVDLQCTMPDIIVSPSDITRDGCHATVTYAVSDTGRPGPIYTYAFSGATTATGSGTGSGSVFNTGVTTVTLTATNECGSSSRSFNVTIQPLPTTYSVTGGGLFCVGGSGVAVALSGSQPGVFYQLYNGSSAVGSPIAGTGGSIGFGSQVSLGTYTVLATDNTTGCTRAMASSATVANHPIASQYNVVGGGNYCVGSAGSPVGLNGSQLGIHYVLYQGSVPVSTPVAGTGGAISFGSYTNIATYSVVGTNTVTTCATNMANTVAIPAVNPLPALHNITGGGSFCAGATGVPVGLDGSETGVTYRLFSGSTMIGTPLPGNGSPLNFGTFTSAGSYHVVASISATGCSETMNGVANVVMNPLPAVQMVTGGGAYCEGGSGVAIALSGSETGVSYQLMNGGTGLGSALSGTGGAVSFGSYTASGTYTVGAFNATTGCINTMAGMATVVVNPVPTTFAVTGGGSYCDGGAGVLVGLVGSEAGVNYQLYNGSSMVGPVVAGAGTSFDFGSLTGAGSYSVKAIDAVTACENNMTGSATVAVTPLETPSVTLVSSATGPVCAGTVVTFTTSDVAAGATPAYEWSVGSTVMATGVTSYSLTPANGDVVTVKLTSSLPCVTSAVATASATMTVNPMVTPTAAIAATPGDSVCAGTPVSFAVTATHPGASPVFNWSVNGTTLGTSATYSFVPDSGDVVSLSMTSNAPCRLATTVASNTVKLRTFEQFMPVVSLKIGGKGRVYSGEMAQIIATVNHAGPSPEYRWMINALPVAGATSATLTTDKLKTGDSVTCIVSGTAPCGLDGVNSLKVTAYVGIDGIFSGNALRVIPNPNTGTFAVRGAVGEMVVGTVAMTVTNVLGQEVYRNNIDAKDGNIDEVITLGAHLPDGIYLLTVTAATGSNVFQVMLKR